MLPYFCHSRQKMDIALSQRRPTEKAFCARPRGTFLFPPLWGASFITASNFKETGYQMVIRPTSSPRLVTKSKQLCDTLSLFSLTHLEPYRPLRHKRPCRLRSSPRLRLKKIVAEPVSLSDHPYSLPLGHAGDYKGVNPLNEFASSQNEIKLVLGNIGSPPLRSIH